MGPPDRDLRSVLPPAPAGAEPRSGLSGSSGAAGRAAPSPAPDVDASGITETGPLASEQRWPEDGYDSRDGRLETEPYSRPRDELVTPLAGLGTRALAYIIGNPVVGAFSAIPTLGNFVLLFAFFGNLLLYRQGQDIGAAAMKLRVLRDNGDVAGFFHMWTRSLVSIISILALGAGYWTAYSDPRRQTWHDKIMRTVVVIDADEYRNRRRSSSDAAVGWFIVSLVLAFVIPLLIAWLFPGDLAATG